MEEKTTIKTSVLLLLGHGVPMVKVKNTT